MFESVEEVIHMIEGSYKKFKSYYYYDKTLLYIKDKIAEFELDSELFNKSLKLISYNLFNRNQEYFDDLINNIKFRVLPKSFISSPSDSDVIKCNLDHNKYINKLNFCIDLPIELLIIDTLWMLLISKISQDNFGDLKHSYAGKIKKSVFNKSKDLYKGIDFNSNRCFEPYFNQYCLWKNRAFDSVKKHQDDTDIVMMTLDLKSFYYSVQFDFDELDNMLNNDYRLHEIKFITEILHKVYSEYTALISKYKNGIDKSTKYSILPIGLLSPVILRELYLKNLDKEFHKKLSVFYYGRYVDDIILVIPTENETKEYTVDRYINKYLVKNKIIFSENGSYKFFKYNNMKIQKEKINCFYFQKGDKNILIEVYDKIIRKNSSEANMLPDIDLLNESFNSRVYNINTPDGSSKIRNFKFIQSDNYNATLFVNGLKRLIQNTDFQLTKLEKWLDEILEFYNKSQGIEFSASWRSVFELLVLCKDKNRIRKFYSSIDNYINKLSFDLLNEDEVISKRKNVLLNKLKFSLKSKLNSASALAIALNYESGTYKRKKLAIKFRNSNMMNHKLIAYPLMNYSNSDIFKNIVSLIDLNNQLLNFKNIKELFKLDEEKLKWSPRFIHLNELYFYMFFYFIGVNRKFYIDNNDEVFKEYLKINNLPKNISNPVIEDDIIDINGISIKTQNINVFERNIPNKTRIGLVNTQISETNILKYMLNPSSGMTIDNKKRLYKVLKAAHEQKVKYLVFPEFYLPVIWVNDINNFARQYGITVITGLQYITHNKRAYNIVYIAKSVQSKFGFRNCIPLYREKNNYAPNEKLQLAKLGYKCKDATQPMYYIINNGTLSIGIILCFEFTDINSRAGMKSKVDILFIPQLNRDTNYFASIVESSARDLHCFIVQANTSAYGDSRITAPYKTNFKDIVRIKGGINDIVIVGEVNVAELKKQHKTYNINLQAQINKCIKCTKIKDKIKDIKKIEEKCSKCKDNWNRKGTMKGLPPKF